MSRKKKSKAKVIQLSPENYIKQKSRTLPIYKCYITPEWEDAKLVNIFIGRKHINGNITFGGYLVDLLCKGVKDSMYNFNVDIDDFEEMVNQNELTECDYALAHNIIFAGLEFGEDNGFQPHKDFRISEYILEEDDSIELIDIQLGGEDGKPLLTEQNPIRFQRDLKVLEKTLGRGNFDFIEGIDDDSYDDFEELDEIESDEFDDEDFVYDDIDEENIDEEDIEDFQNVVFTNLSYDILFPPDKSINRPIIDPRKILATDELEFDEDSTILIDDFFDILDFEEKRSDELISIVLQVIDKYPQPETYEFFINNSYRQQADVAKTLIDNMKDQYPNHVILLYYQLLFAIEENNASDIEGLFKQITDFRYIKIHSLDAVYIGMAYSQFHLYHNDLNSANISFMETNSLSIEYEHAVFETDYISQKLTLIKTDIVFDKMETFTQEDAAEFERKMQKKGKEIEEYMKNRGEDSE